MKFGKMGTVGKVTLVLAMAFGIATLFTACASHTVAFLFVATTKQTPGQIEVYYLDSLAGILRTIPASPFPSGGRNPVSEAVSPDFKNLYVANQDDNNIVQFAIGKDGKLYPQSTVNTPGSFPLTIAINAAGTYLYVVDALEPLAGCSLQNPCPGALAVFPVNKTSGALGAPVVNNDSSIGLTYWPLTLTSSTAAGDLLTPTALEVTANDNNVYVTAYDATSGAGYVFGFCADSGVSTTSFGCNDGIDPSTKQPIPTLPGTLTPLAMGPVAVTPLKLGVKPLALTSDSGTGYLYAADQQTNRITSFAISQRQPASDSAHPTPPVVNPGFLAVAKTANTGNQPSALTLYNDSFLYVTNSLDSTVNAYSANAGSLTQVGTYASDTDPIALTTDPRHVGFLYTVNFLGNTLSGFKIDPTSGALINAQHSPYLSSVQPVAIVGVPHGGLTK